MEEEEECAFDDEDDKELRVVGICKETTADVGNAGLLVWKVTERGGLERGGKGGEKNERGSG